MITARDFAQETQGFFAIQDDSSVISGIEKFLEKVRTKQIIFEKITITETCTNGDWVRKVISFSIVEKSGADPSVG